MTNRRTPTVHPARYLSPAEYDAIAARSAGRALAEGLVATGVPPEVAERFNSIGSNPYLAPDDFLALCVAFAKARP